MTKVIIYKENYEEYLDAVLEKIIKDDLFDYGYDRVKDELMYAFNLAVEDGIEEDE